MLQNVITRTQATKFEILNSHFAHLLSANNLISPTNNIFSISMTVNTSLHLIMEFQLDPNRFYLRHLHLNFN